VLAKVFLSDKSYGSATTYESRHCVKFIFRDNENISVLKDNSNLIFINSLFFFFFRFKEIESRLRSRSVLSQMLA
jgi:hypothetical protein